jgi:hypothetical protein
MRRLAAAALAGLAVAAAPPAQAAGALDAARALAAATPAPARASLQHPFTEQARTDWHYTPRNRDGVPWKSMSEAQRAAATALMRSALSEAGLAKVRAVMALEIVLREVETFAFSRDPDNYAFAVYGVPAADAAWGWRIEGHHLSLHFSLVGDRYVATLPQFFGANPAELARDFPKAGMKKGTRVLGREEDLARELVDSLDAKQRQAATIADRPYGDIVTRNAATLDPMTPVGVTFDTLTVAQQATLLKLVTAFAEHLEPPLAEARLARVREGGLATLRFGWAGSTRRGEPYYFRIQGPRVLIELDNSGGNHVHSVWRDADGDWGRDVLREHYRRAAGTPHRH